MSTTSSPIDFEEIEEAEAPDREKKIRPPIDWKMWLLTIAAVLVAALIIAFLTRDEGGGGREQVRSKAEAVLRARFNDTSNSVGPLKSLKVEWQGDQLVATWTQGENAQKRCTAPVQISPDEQNFGIEAFEPVPFDKQSATQAHCVVTAGLEYGFPLE